MMRWLKEFLEPALKCTRLGHASIREDHIVMRRCTGDAHRWVVVMKAREMRTRCGRCGFILVEPSDREVELTAAEADKSRAAIEARRRAERRFS